jgi:hypothetical protein
MSVSPRKERGEDDRFSRILRLADITIRLIVALSRLPIHWF